MIREENQLFFDTNVMDHWDCIFLERASTKVYNQIEEGCSVLAMFIVFEDIQFKLHNDIESKLM